MVAFLLQPRSLLYLLDECCIPLLLKSLSGRKLACFHLLAKLFQIGLDNIYPGKLKELPLYHHSHMVCFVFGLHQ